MIYAATPMLCVGVNIATVTGLIWGTPTTTVTSTFGYSKATYWGLAVPNGKASGSYSGINVFQSLFSP